MLNNNNLITDPLVASQYLLDGELVAFPTETVYGLGADARNPYAIKKVFAAKGRPADHPVIVHIGHQDQLGAWARDIPDTATQLAERFWPGPLTLILYKQPEVSNLITGGQDTIGLRIPKHDLTLKMLQEFGSGIVGPSANKYGRVSPTSPHHVASDLGSAVAAILDGGSCTVGIESTIIDLTAKTPTIMRHGAISVREIEQVLGQKVIVNTGAATMRTPGSHASHYAPRKPVFLVNSADLDMEVKRRLKSQEKFSVISFNACPEYFKHSENWQQENKDPQKYAQFLYANLRTRDKDVTSLILIEHPPYQAEWAAVIDRLSRASTRAACL